MSNLKWLAILGFSMVVTAPFSGCATNTRDLSAAPQKTVRPRVHQDMLLEGRVQELLRLANMSSVTPVVNRSTGLVWLSGTVSDRATLDRVIGVVSSIKGVTSVHNDLKLVPVAATEPSRSGFWAAIVDSRMHLLWAFVVGMFLLMSWRMKAREDRIDFLEPTPSRA